VARRVTLNPTTMGWLFWAAVFAKAILVISLVPRRLAQRFPWFTAFLIVSIATELSLLWIPHRSLTYTYTWMAVEPFLWLLRIAVVVEAYNQLARLYPCFGRDCSRMFIATIAAAAILSIVLLPIEIPRVPKMQTLVTSYMLMVVAKRYITLLAALFIGLMISFCFRNGIPVSRNLAAHGGVLALYFAFDAGTCFVSMLKGTMWADTYLLPASFILILFWPFAYKRGADTAKPIVLTEEDKLMIQRGPALRAAISELEWELRKRR
jgi:hypothetical protein